MTNVTGTVVDPNEISNDVQHQETDAAAQQIEDAEEQLGDNDDDFDDDEPPTDIEGNIVA